MLKSLFIPHDGFFTEWLDDLNSYFGDAFGILYYPFELLIDFLNRISTISDSGTAIISFGDLTIDFMGYHATLIHAYSYNLNDLLANATFKNIHTIYLTVMDIILWLGVVYLANHCLHSIIGGMGNELADTIDDSYEGERSYERYKQGQANKERYKREKRGN